MKKPKKKTDTKSPTSSDSLSWMDKIRAAGDRALAQTKAELANETEARQAQGKVSEQAQKEQSQEPSNVPKKRLTMIEAIRLAGQLAEQRTRQHFTEQSGKPSRRDSETAEKSAEEENQK